MKKNIFLAIISWVLLITSTNAQNAEAFFLKANEQYKQQQFEQAAEQYRQIITLGYRSAEVYYNLGNCYYKTNQVGLSVLNYERAYKMQPDNEDIAFNLKLANLKVNDRIEPAPQMMVIKWVNRFFTSQSADGWSKMAVVSIWLAAIAGIAFLWLNHFTWKRLLFVFSVLFLFSSVLFLAVAWKQKNYEAQHQFGIVLVTNTYIKSAPQTNATDLFILREGAKAEVIETQNLWHKIKLADGKVGWIKADDIEVI